MKENKTKPTIIDVSTYLNQLDESKKLEAKELIHLFSEASLEKPIMWGSSIIGFGQKIYHYESGRKVDYFYIGFSMRKKAITLYIMDQVDQIDLSKLGNVEHGVGCIYIKKLSDINKEELINILKKAVQSAKERP